jgi:hypothetical protein
MDAGLSQRSPRLRAAILNGHAGLDDDLDRDAEAVVPRIVYVKVSNPRVTYVTSVPNDPNVPAGYVLTNTSDGSWQGADSVHDQNLQTYVGGLASGGYPTYSGYSDGSTNNGHLGGN